MHFSCLINKINKQLSQLTSKLDIRILMLQKQELASKPIEKIESYPLEILTNNFATFESKQISQEKTKSSLKSTPNRNLKQELKNVMESLNVVESDLLKAKSRTYQLHKENLCFEAKRSHEMLNAFLVKCSQKTSEKGITLIR